MVLLLALGGYRGYTVAVRWQADRTARRAAEEVRRARYERAQDSLRLVAQVAEAATADLAGLGALDRRIHERGFAIDHKVVHRRATRASIDSARRLAAVARSRPDNLRLAE